MQAAMIREVEAVLGFYNSNNRAIAPLDDEDTERCVYHATSCSPGCAIGRRMTEAELQQWGSHMGSVGSIYVAARCGGGPVLSYWDRFPMPFLSSLQDLHDQAINWNDRGLSDVGRRKASRLIEKIADGFYWLSSPAWAPAAPLKSPE